MRLVRRKSDSILRRASLGLDALVGVLSPAGQLRRARSRFAYDILDSHRTRRKRSGMGGTADQHLTADALDKLREISRDLALNNPLVTGLLRKEANGAVGTDTKIQARSSDTEWNVAAEQFWTDEMINKPCDITGRFDINYILKNGFKSYRRDGDVFLILGNDFLQPIEGEQVGTPYGAASLKPRHFDIVNGVAISKKTKRVLGYYIGTPNKWGYIADKSFKKYPTDRVHHVFNPERFSCTRGEPVLVSAVDIIDKVWGYLDAELVKSKVHACLSAFVTSKDNTGMPPAYTQGISSTGQDADDNRLEKMEPGTMVYGEPGEDVKMIGQTSPGQNFDPFMLRMMAIIGSPMNMALMLVTGDFSGATFMNARIAYQEVRDNWKEEQNLVIKPLARRIWLWRIGRAIETGELSPAPDDWFRHEVMCKRWPYVDPYKEAMADKVQLANATTTRTAICARQGQEFGDVVEQLGKEQELIRENNVTPPTSKKVPA